MQKIDILTAKDGTGYSLVVNNDGLIEAIGPAVEIGRQYENATFGQRYDCTNKTLLPGFVDAHTHPVWAGDRVHEFAMKLAGASYMQIHEAGGGIHFTVEKTRAATEDELFQVSHLRCSNDCGDWGL